MIGERFSTSATLVGVAGIGIVLALLVEWRWREFAAGRRVALLTWFIAMTAVALSIWSYWLYPSLIDRLPIGSLEYNHPLATYSVQALLVPLVAVFLCVIARCGGGVTVSLFFAVWLASCLGGLIASPPRTAGLLTLAGVLKSHGVDLPGAFAPAAPVYIGQLIGGAIVFLIALPKIVLCTRNANTGDGAT